MSSLGSSHAGHPLAGARSIGAVGALFPSAVFLALSVVTRAQASWTDMVPAVGGVTLVAVVVGWFVGPLAKGSFRSDLFALMAYALLAGVGYLFLGSVRGAWADPLENGERDLAERIVRLVGQTVYGLLYLPFWAVFISPFAFAWVVAVRILRNAGMTVASATVEPAQPGPARANRTRRLVLIAAAAILGYGLFVATLPLMLYDEPSSPWWLERPIGLLALFGIPGLVATIGAVRGIRPLVIAAAVLCLMQAYIAFSGVTIGFVVPGLLLLVLGSAERWPNAPRVTGTSLFASIAVIVLTVSAWVSLLGLTTPRCYTYHEAADGTRVYTEVPTAGRISVGDGASYGSGSVSVAGSGEGCSSAELTPQGIGTATTLAIGAIAVAAFAGTRPPDLDPT